MRDIGNSTDMPMTIGHYLNAMDKLTRQWTPTNFRDPKRQRLYLKDIDCPEAWYQHLHNIVPHTLFYLNDCVGEQGGAGATHEQDMYNQVVGVGPAGDLMSNLPSEMRAQNMMCYIGHEGTYTPAHREMCASLGQNIMVETSTTESGEKVGSSIWFMTESKDREVVSEYFLSMLGHDIEVESHFAQINAWKKAPFPVYIVEQRAGDFVLIPPLAPHQVWNRGTRTMKVAWNRTTVETLELALHEALPRARMVCRDEQYKNKAIIYYSLLRYYDQLKRIQQAEDASWEGHVKESIRNAVRVRQLKKDFKRLFTLYTEVLLSEMFSPDLPKEKNVEFVAFDSNVTCSYCRCNIFNRFLTCKTCIGEVEETGEEDTYDVCMECYAMGRSCGCLSNLQWVEQWQWSELMRHYEEWRAMVISNDGFVDSDSPPLTLDIARRRYGKKPVAHVCQEQLKRRPWKDISMPDTKSLSPTDSEEEPEVDDEGRVKKKRLPKRKEQHPKNRNRAHRCHICQHKEWKWKLASCTTCISAYCYGTLWRAFDLEPQTVMENPNWQCPKCLNICSCAKCRRNPSQRPYHPKGTLLGHDTRAVADPRSVESLVNFGHTNLKWLREAEPDYDPQTSLRMQKLMEKAQTEKERDETLDDEIIVGDGRRERGTQNSVGPGSASDIAIDPQLRDHEPEHNASVLGAGPNGSIQSTLPEKANARTQDASSDSGDLVNPNITQVHHNDHRPKAQTQNGATAPVISVYSSPYPVPSGPARDRMMGMGYYQQANDADKILFDHPDISTPVGHETSVAYPRLLVQAPDFTEPSSAKRARESMPTISTGEVDEAHAQFFQAQKKQKLAHARKNGTYIMTQNQLEGGRTMIVRLPLRRSKQFLQRLEELDRGQMLPRHNPRNPRRNVTSQEQHWEDDDNSMFVRSDVPIKAVTRRREESDDGEDSIILATRAIGNLPMPSITPVLGQDEPLPKGKRARRPRKSEGMSIESDTEYANKIPPRRHTIVSSTSDPPGGKRLFSPTLARRRGHSKTGDELSPEFYKHHDNGDAQIEKPKTISPSSEKSGQSRPASLAKTSPDTTNSLQTSRPLLEVVPTEQHSPMQHSSKDTPRSIVLPNNPAEETHSMEDATERDDVPVSRPAASFNSDFDENTEGKEVPAPVVSLTSELIGDTERDAVPVPMSTASSISEVEEDDSFVLVDDDFRPISTAPVSETKQAEPKTSLSVSQDYLMAKEQAWRMIEDELEEEAIIEPQKQDRRQSAGTVPQPAKATSISSATKAPTVSVKPLPKARSGKLMSMAERQALKGKAFRIVAAKSATRSPSSASPVLSVSKSLSMKKVEVVIHSNSTAPLNDYASDSLSSDDDDESIPAVRPVAKKPRIEAMAGLTNNIKENVKPVSSVPLGMKRVKYPF